MSHQTKTVKLVSFFTLLAVLTSGLLVIAGEDTQYKSFTSEEFGFSISYPESWEKSQLPEEENEPQIYQHTSLRLYPSENLPASVTIYVTELTSPASLDELKRYLELRPKFDPWRSGLTDVRLGKFADSRAVLAEYNRISFYEETVTDGSGSEKTKWKKSTWKGKMRGIIRNGYLLQNIGRRTPGELRKSQEKILEQNSGFL